MLQNHMSVTAPFLHFEHDTIKIRHFSCYFPLFSRKLSFT